MNMNNNNNKTKCLGMNKKGLPCKLNGKAEFNGYCRYHKQEIKQDIKQEITAPEGIRMGKLGRSDFHIWNKTSTSSIIDNVNDIKTYYDRIAETQLETNNYDIVYKEWNKIPKHILDNIKNKMKLTKQTKQEIQAMYDSMKYVPNYCLTLGVYRKILTGFEIAVGSLGLKSRITGEIWWEYGNGRNDWKDDIIQYTSG